MKKYIITRKNGKKVTFIGVNHTKTLENNEINNVIQGNNKILLEENTFLNHNQLMKKFSDLKVYELTSINIYAKLNLKKQLNRISGWDSRPAYLNNEQTSLYGADQNNKPFFLTHTMEEVNRYFIKHIPGGNNKFKSFIKFSKTIQDDKLENLIKNKKISQTFIEQLHSELKKDHALIADDYTLKNVLPQYKNEDVTIIAGSKHYDNLIKKFKG